MKTKIVSAFEQIEKKTILDALVGKLTTICTAAIQCDKFDFITGDIDSYLSQLVDSFPVQQPCAHSISTCDNE